MNHGMVSEALGNLNGGRHEQNWQHQQRATEDGRRQHKKATSSEGFEMSEAECDREMRRIAKSAYDASFSVAV